MSKKVFKYFGGFIKAQQNWLNAMSSRGYRLVKTGRLIYEFEEVEPHKYQYYIDFVAHKSSLELKNYKDFLTDVGYKTISKNININYSLGKISFRPYGEGKGKIATSPGSYNKELLIIEKISDGKPFELYTTLEDKLALVKVRRNAAVTAFILFFAFFILQWVQTKTIMTASLVFLLFAIITIFPVIGFNNSIVKLKRQLEITE